MSSSVGSVVHSNGGAGHEALLSGAVEERKPSPSLYVPYACAGNRGPPARIWSESCKATQASTSRPDEVAEWRRNVDGGQERGWERSWRRQAPAPMLRGCISSNPWLSAGLMLRRQDALLTIRTRLIPSRLMILNTPGT